jgi:S1-C subfamily serine protease
MKSLIKVAILSSVTTAALIYVLLEWRPFGDIRSSPIVTWASPSSSSSSSSSAGSPFPEPKGGRVPISEDELNNIEVYQKTNTGVVNITSASVAYDIFYRPIPQSGVGSGVIIDNLGHIVTNHHVVQDADELEVTLADKSTYSAKVIGDDPNNDLAVVQITAPKDKLSPIPLGTSSKDLQVGQKVLAIGNPYRLDRTLTTGIISSLGRSITTDKGTKIEGVIQTDAAINPGNSGGPLLNSNGEVIGINSAIVGTANGGNVGIGFAIPVETVHRIAEDLIKYGYVRRPYLGVEAIQLSDIPGDAARLGIEPKGLLVYSVAPGSPAALAGLRPAQVGIYRGGRQALAGGDIILSFDNKEVNYSADLGIAIDKHKAGDRVSITVLRNNQKVQVAVTLQEAPHGNR